MNKNLKVFPISQVCGHCSNTSLMEDVGSVYNDLTIVKEGEHDYGYLPQFGNYYHVLICPACKNENIIKYHYSELMESNEGKECSLLYPLNNDIPLGLPNKIKTAFQEAEKVKALNVNAYAILMRRLLELVCLDKHSEAKTLSQMLTDLASKNEIPSKLVDLAGSIKNFGNIGAHASSGELTVSEIPIVGALTKAILEYIYSAPYLISVAEAKIKEIKKINSM
ncbi:MAG: hypothetical protein COC06_10215 [Bacteroidales bacterium]|nr:MAG: hypothetical protein COC06_10215 [Bacteroidales bacterium]